MGKSAGSILKKHLQAPDVRWPTTTLQNSTSSAGSSTHCTSKVRVREWQCNGQTSPLSVAAITWQLTMMMTYMHNSFTPFVQSIHSLSYEHISTALSAAIALHALC